MKKENNVITVVIEAPCGINSQTSKSEEIAILSAITDRVKGTQTYLESLFTEELFEFAAGKIKDDFSPDIMAHYYAELETNRNLSNELAKVKTQLEYRDRDYERLENKAKDELIAKDNKIAEKVELLNSRQVTLANCQVALGDERRIKAAITGERDDLKNQLRDLKAMLFDMMNEKAA